MSLSGVRGLVALASVLLLGQLSRGKGQPWPFTALNQHLGFGNREDAMLYQATISYHKALNYLGKQHNCTYLSAPGEKVHVSVANIHGQIYNFRTVVVKAKCPEEQGRVTLKNCEIIPGSLKYLCTLEMVTYPAFNIHKINILSCKELPANTSTPVSSAETGNEKEEGTPYV